MAVKDIGRFVGLLAAVSCAVGCFFNVNPCLAQDNSDKTYVGSESCQPCHERQYGSFIANAAKVRSFEHVQIMKKGLTEAEYQGCLKCHTTGHGEPGGFVSLEATPALKNPGCEVCHGPGSQHIDSGDPKDIKQPNMAVCEKCHTTERVSSFKFKPVLYGGAH